MSDLTGVVLAKITPFSHGEWVAAAIWLGEDAESAMPTVVAMCNTRMWRPLGAAMALSAAITRLDDAATGPLPTQRTRRVSPGRLTPANHA